MYFLSDSIDLLITSQRELLKKAPFSKIITLAPNVLNSATEEVLKCSHLAEEKYSKYVCSYYIPHCAVECIDCDNARWPHVQVSTEDWLH